jgi:predicted DNA-binding protein (MmcQ/YjbR family)
MDIDFLRTFCLNKPGTTEEFPFDDKTLVFKVMGKMYALCRLETDPMEVNLKCDPERAEVLRESYDSIRPGFHMNKKHWNTLVLDGELPFKLVKDLINHSYTLVYDKLPKKTRLILDEANEEI